MIGIYSITSPTGKIYIGQSWNVEKRISTYKRVDCVGQPAIYASLKKHGADSHTISLLKGLPEITTQAQLDFWEKYCISTFRTLGVEMLNIKEGGSNGKMAQETKDKLSISKSGIKREYFAGELNPYYGKKHSLEVRRKMSISNKGNKVGIRNGRAMAIIQYDLNMNYIADHLTVTNAALELNIYRQLISDALNGRRKRAGGFIFKYKDKLCVKL